MAYVKVRENENLDSSLKRFKRQCTKEGIISDIKRKDEYNKPSVARKKKAEAAKKRKNSRD